MSLLSRPTNRIVDFIDAILRENTTFENEQARSSRISIPSILISICLIAPIYGAAMGSYAAVSGERSLIQQAPQIIYSAVKMPLILLMTLMIAVPGFFVFNRLAGLKDDFVDSVKAIVSSLSSFAIVLVSLCPITLFVYVSLSPGAESYRFAVVFNALIFGVAATSSQIVLFRRYRQLFDRDQRHRLMLAIWVTMFAFVGIQAGWTLRPFIGSPSQCVSFFRDEPFSNAWVRAGQLVHDVVGETFFGS